MRKGKMWSRTDSKHFEGKTLTELYKQLENAEKFVQEHPQFEFGWHNEYRQELRRRIAELIGRKK